MVAFAIQGRLSAGMSSVVVVFGGPRSGKTYTCTVRVSLCTGVVLYVVIRSHYHSFAQCLVVGTLSLSLFRVSQPTLGWLYVPQISVYRS